MKNHYGARVRTCGGFFATYFCTSRSLADRVRRVTRAYLEAGGFAGHRTINALVDLIVESKHKRTEKIIAEFYRRGEMLRDQEA